MGKRVGGKYFVNPLILGVSLCLFTVAAAYFFFFQFDERDEREYRRLMIESNPALAGHSEQTPYTARQSRSIVQKDFAFLKNNAPLHVKLLSREAELVFDRDENSMQIIENLRGIKVYMQEELLYMLPDGREAVQLNGRLLIKNAPSDKETSWMAIDAPGVRPMQILKYLEAETGSYYYKGQVCNAANVTIERYLQPGHQIDRDLQKGTLLFKAVAERVEFSMTGSEPKFTAFNMQAQVFNLEMVR